MTAFERGLQALTALQRPDGELPTWAGRTDEPLESWTYESSPFVTTFVLHALRDVAQASALRERAVSWLIRQMEPPGVWRWYTASGPHPELEPDLDDICCASDALRDRHPHIFLGANHALILSARDARGRFQTWLGRPPGRNDVDAILNANVLLYLGERPETRAAAAWLQELALEGGLRGTYRYYTDEAAFWYMAARCAARGQAWARACLEPLRRATRQRPDDPLSLAYLLAARAAVGEPLDPTPLLAYQRDDGLWPRTAAYRLHQQDGRHIDWGSEALTTAIALEALHATG